MLVHIVNETIESVFIFLAHLKFNYSLVLFSLLDGHLSAALFNHVAATTNTADVLRALGCATYLESRTDRRVTLMFANQLVDVLSLHRRSVVIGIWIFHLARDI